MAADQNTEDQQAARLKQQLGGKSVGKLKWQNTGYFMPGTEAQQEEGQWVDESGQGGYMPSNDGTSTRSLTAAADGGGADGRTYGNYQGTYDANGNLTDVKFNKMERKGGFIFENAGPIMAAITAAISAGAASGILSQVGSAGLSATEAALGATGAGWAGGGANAVAGAGTGLIDGAMNAGGKLAAIDQIPTAANGPGGSLLDTAKGAWKSAKPYLEGANLVKSLVGGAQAQPDAGGAAPGGAGVNWDNNRVGSFRVGPDGRLI